MASICKQCLFTLCVAFPLHFGDAFNAFPAKHMLKDSESDASMTQGLSLIQVLPKHAEQSHSQVQHSQHAKLHRPKNTQARRARADDLMQQGVPNKSLQSGRHHVDPAHRRTGEILIPSQKEDSLWNASLPERLVGHRIVQEPDSLADVEEEVVVTQDQYWSTVPLALPVFVIGVLISWRTDRTGISQALGAACIWGVNGFLIALSGSMPPDSKYTIGGYMYMAWMWSFTFVVACGCHVFYKLKHAEAYAAELKDVGETPRRVWVAYALAAITCCAAEACLQSGFSSDEKSSGPHFAIATATSPIVAPFFWYYSGETMAFWQIVGLCAVVAGTVVMSASSLRSALAVVTMLVSMLLWAVDLITIRLAGVWGGKPCVGCVARLFMISSCGMSLVLLNYGVLGATLPPLYALLPPMLNSFINGCGFLSLIQSFEGEHSIIGVNVGLLPSQTLVMTLMNCIIMQWHPCTQDWLGMLVVSAGCTLLSVGSLLEPASLEESFEAAATRLKLEQQPAEGTKVM